MCPVKAQGQTSTRLVVLVRMHTQQQNGLLVKTTSHISHKKLLKEKSQNSPGILLLRNNVEIQSSDRNAPNY